MPTKLFSRNMEVDGENDMHFARLPGAPVSYTAQDSCSNTAAGQALLRNLQRDCQAHETVQLKKDAQIILLKNLDPAIGLCNGSRGVVLDLVPLRQIPFGEHGIEAIYNTSTVSSSTILNYFLSVQEHVPLVLFANGIVRYIFPMSTCGPAVGSAVMCVCLCDTMHD